jgi:hypothetical protein
MNRKLLRLELSDGAPLDPQLFRALPVRIGRDPVNECRLAHPFVSQFHAVIELQGDALVVRDLGSLNGICVGESLAPIDSQEAVSLAPTDGEFNIRSLRFRAVLIDEVGAHLERLARWGHQDIRGNETEHYDGASRYFDPIASDAEAAREDAELTREAPANDPAVTLVDAPVLDLDGGRDAGRATDVSDHLASVLAALAPDAIEASHSERVRLERSRAAAPSLWETYREHHARLSRALRASPGILLASLERTPAVTTETERRQASETP